MDEYQIVTAKSPAELTSLVRDAIAAGWTVTGGLATTPSQFWEDGAFLQAMTKPGAGASTTGFIHAVVGTGLLTEHPTDAGADEIGYPWSNCPDASAATCDANGTVRWWFGKSAPHAMIPVGSGHNPLAGFWDAVDGVVEVEECCPRIPVAIDWRIWDTSLRRRPNA